MAKAAGAKSRLFKWRPDFTIARMKVGGVSDNPLFWQQTETYVFTGLRKAGVPEQ
jgi:hypothetical protein